MDDPIRRFTYSLHPAFAMQAKMIENMREKTGRTMDEWLAVLNTSGSTDSKTAGRRLKEEFGLTHGFAMLIADIAGGGERAGEYDPVRYVESLFSGERAALLPLYELLMTRCFALGNDIRACPCATFVPIYRDRVIAQIKPTTQTRIDFGLALGNRAPEGRLINTGGFARKDRITHRLAVSAPADIDDELDRWLRLAYDLDA